MDGLITTLLFYAQTKGDNNANKQENVRHS